MPDSLEKKRERQRAHYWRKKAGLVTKQVPKEAPRDRPVPVPVPGWGFRV